MKSRRPASPGAAGQSLTSPTHFDPLWLGTQLHSLIGPLRDRALCVAYSGGLDSSALLYALAALRRREGFALRALHVNHQLLPHAAAWARQARRQARSLRVPCEVLRVSVSRERGESLEAAARTARYRALLSRLHSDELLLTAHHQEDLLETVLLALMRGSGLRGLSSLRVLSTIEGIGLLRPLLPVARAQLEHYLRARQVTWSEDPSNADVRFDRNYLRRSIVPALRARWPAAAATVARSAALLSESRLLLERVALEQLKPARDGRALRVSVLRRLPMPERINVLRTWLAERGLPMPDQLRMREIAGPMLAARPDSTPQVQWSQAQLRRHGDRLFAFAIRGLTKSKTASAVEVARWDWRAQPWLSLHSAGSLGLVRDPHGDVRLSALPSQLGVRYRAHGERLQGAHGHLSLKDLLQQRGLAPWERDVVPLVMHGQSVVAVADLWVCPKYAVRDGADNARGRFRWRRSRAD